MSPAPTSDRFGAGTAYIDGRYMPIAEAAIPITDWGYRRSDVTYDVVSVRDGQFFRLEDHIRRLRSSMQSMRMEPKESDDDIRRILNCCVATSGLRDAYVAIDCLRGRPPPGVPYHPAYARNYITAYAVPWISLLSHDVVARGAHLVVAETIRIPPRSLDPRIKNFHWADLTRGQFEAFDRGADFCVLPDEEGNITEGPGFNVFLVKDGGVVTPDAGVLEGITRRSVLELCDELGIAAEIRRITTAEFRDADEIFVTSSAGGIMPVSRIDGRMMGNDRPGPLYRELHDAYWKRRAEGWHATPVEYRVALASAP